MSPRCKKISYMILSGCMLSSPSEYATLMLLLCIKWHGWAARDRRRQLIKFRSRHPLKSAPSTLRHVSVSVSWPAAAASAAVAAASQSGQRKLSSCSPSSYTHTHTIEDTGRSGEPCRTRNARDAQCVCVCVCRVCPVCTMGQDIVLSTIAAHIYIGAHISAKYILPSFIHTSRSAQVLMASPPHPVPPVLALNKPSSGTARNVPAHLHRSFLRFLKHTRFRCTRPSLLYADFGQTFTRFHYFYLKRLECGCRTQSHFAYLDPIKKNA